MKFLTRQKKIWFLLLFILLVAGAFFLAEGLRNQYSFVSPKRGLIVEAIYGLGRVKTHRKYEVKIGVMSKIVNTYVDEGAKAKKGDKLVKFSDFETVTAPFDGTVTKLNFREPEMVFPNTIVLTLEDLRNRYIEVSLEQEGALRVRPGQDAKVLFESIRGFSYKGEVETVFPKEEEFLVHIEIPELTPNILPGMTADVTIDVARDENALLIPVESVSNGTALIRRDGKKLKVPVRIGSVDGNWAQVLDGDIRPGDEALVKE